MTKTIFCVGMRVSWCGARGTVDTKLNGVDGIPVISVIFDDSERRFQFEEDGRYADWHTKPSLKKLVKKKRAVETVPLPDEDNLDLLPERLSLNCSWYRMWKTVNWLLAEARKRRDK